MSWLSATFQGLVALIRGKKVRQDADDEILQFIADARQEFMERGMAHAAAERAARVAFGSPLAVRDELMSRGWESKVRALATDVGYAVRTLVRARWFTTSTVLTLAVGIGLTTTLFSVAYGLLLRPLPWADAERLVRVEERRGGMVARATRWTVTNGFYHAWAPLSSSTIQTAGSWTASTRTLIDESGPERVMTATITPSVLELLGTTPTLGRVFVEADTTRGTVGVALISHGLWRARFGGDAGVIGRPLRLDDRIYQIVGVLPESVAFPDATTRVWTPFRPLPLLSGDGRQLRIIHVNMLARLRPGASAEQAAAEATAVAQTVPSIGRAALSQFGSDGQITVAVSPVLDVMLAEAKPAMTFLLVAVGLLLGAATASVASMQLARATARRREMAVRLAIGAGRGRLVQQWLVESGVLGVTAGAMGLALSWLLHQLARSMLAGAFPRVEDILLDATVWLFAAAMTVVVSAVCGFVPALLVVRQRLTGSLFAERGDMAALSQRIRIGHLRMLILGGQVAIACVLLIGASVLTRSFAVLAMTDRGYDADHVLTARLNFQHSVTATRRIDMLESIRRQLSVAPGVLRVGFGNGLPLLHVGNVFSQSVPSPLDPESP